MNSTLGHLEALEKGLLMIGKLVKFQIPCVNGKMTIAGVVKRVLPNGDIEIKSQQHGYHTINRNEIII